MEGKKKILITGATDGIGRQTAMMLAKERGVLLVLHGRSLAKLGEVKNELLASYPEAEVETLCADFAVLEAVRVMAQEYLGKHDTLDVLINNAGVYLNKRRVSEDGIEMTMAVNHLAPFLLTHLLLNALKKSGSGRVVNVSSVAHKRGKIDLDDFTSAKDFEPYQAYASSKLANILFTKELVRRLGPNSSVSVNALHPGVVSTKLLQQGFGMDGPDTLEEGAATSVYLALSQAVEGVTGEYFAKSQVATSSLASQDELLAKRFYDASARVVGMAEGSF